MKYPPVAVLADTPDDENLLTGLAIGDAEAKASFVHMFERRVRHAVQAAGVPQTDVPDVTQDVLIEALRQLGGAEFKLRGKLGNWVATLTKGRIIDYRRKSARRGAGRHVSIDVMDVSAASFATPPGQEARILANEARDLMPMRHRMALMLHCRHGISVEELARAFGLSTKRTRTIITEAKAMFRELIQTGEKSPSGRRLKE
jgi:RNA polymerase sigma factor (sigma-70 family)